jgi:tRNA-binding protein
MATIEDFEKVEIRVGKVVQAEDFPEAKIPAYKLLIDFGGELGLKTSSARITNLYTKEDLIGKLVVCVTNLPPRKVGPFVSEVLTTGFYTEDGSVVLASPEREVPLGARLA